jgi:hypothetical protein
MAVVSCGPEAKLQTKYHFPRLGIDDVYRDGDALYILVKSEVMIICDLTFSTDGKKWAPVPKRQNLKAKKLKSTENKNEYGINIVLRIPENMTTENLKFKITATLPDKSTTEKIIEIREIIDSVTPRSKVTFDPFSL